MVQDGACLSRPKETNINVFYIKHLEHTRCGLVKMSINFSFVGIKICRKSRKCIFGEEHGSRGGAVGGLGGVILEGEGVKWGWGWERGGCDAFLFPT